MKPIRKFTCKRCGKEVIVSDPKDKRTKFCSEFCQDRYWKHKHRSNTGKERDENSISIYS